MNANDIYRAQYISLLQMRENLIRDLEDLNIQIKSLVKEAKREKIILPNEIRTKTTTL